METSNENAIEWIRGQKTATVTVSGNTKLNSRVRKIAKERPDECQIDVENNDGSLVAHIPVKWIKINPSKIMTDEEREIARQRAIERFGHKKDIDIEEEDDEDDDEDE